ncbi:glycosyltransferase [Glaciimonas sp. CA11.2]|uniref:glycosyltransferase n=1 Tax=Glaciimonas sp. CA11.2 TaxID=3048601 RepID=UPI002AB48FFD|nr:glycosyltransferase [Glaciimonas sp. CA11.2]MDY7545653.1 glycosyltransferase [Glaciimonas sp. CA11.2]MEB0164717.1 glycosyltransferase [Glaciimonas sp. CA11.2]
MDMMIFLHTVGSLSVDRGGPSRTVSSLSDALASIGVTIYLVTMADSTASDLRCLPSEKGVGTVVAEDAGLPGKLGFYLRQKLVALIREAKVEGIHDHGLWGATNFWSAFSARKGGIPFFLSPRGMLEPWSLAQKRVKKSLAMLIYQRRILNHVSVFFATSKEEANNIRKIGLRQPIAIIPNGVALPETHRYLDDKDGEQTRTVLFLSRIHEKKGLINLVRAWASIAPLNWKLVIAGNDYDGHEATVRREVSKLGLIDAVKFVGSVEGRNKESLYLAADIFVLPTFSENFGVVVAEALAYGVPVITTTGAPWEELHEHDCGWWVAPEVESIARGLQDGMSRTDVERYEMGLRGRQLVAEKYSWSSIGLSTLAVYEWVLKKGPRPDCVV